MHLLPKSKIGHHIYLFQESGVFLCSTAPPTHRWEISICSQTLTNRHSLLILDSLKFHHQVRLNHLWESNNLQQTSNTKRGDLLAVWISRMQGRGKLSQQIIRFVFCEGEGKVSQQFTEYGLHLHHPRFINSVSIVSENGIRSRKSPSIKTDGNLVGNWMERYFILLTRDKCVDRRENLA